MPSIIYTIFFTVLIESNTKANITILIFGIVTIFVYWVFIPYLSKGQTLGMYFLKIKMEK